MRIAVAHHWFVTRGGGERVAECIAALFPRAEMVTLVRSHQGTPRSLRDRRWHTSILQKLPGGATRHRHFLPLYPEAAESLDASAFDLILSSDSGPIKGLHMRPAAVQICYCHAPMRYVWNGFEQYRSAMGMLTRAAFDRVAPRVRAWDREAAQRVTHFLANSENVAQRIRESYGRDAAVIFPPIDTDRAQATRGEPVGTHYLCAGRLVQYKRTDILIAACRMLGRRLLVAGAGPEEAKLRKAAGGDPLIEFMGELATDALWREFARCRALLFAADEDFGMVPLEAQASGRPVIAYGVGGSLETVCDGRTGAFFQSQEPEAVADAILRWESQEASFLSENARAWAANFTTPVFLERYRSFVLNAVPGAAAEAATVAEAMKVLA